MTIRSFVSTIAANRSRTGVAVLLPIGAALVALAALAETAQLLLALADPACAACVDARNLMGGAAAGAGAAGAGAAGAGAAGAGAAGPGAAGSGSVSDRDPWKDWKEKQKRTRDDTAADDVGDVTSRVGPNRPPSEPPRFLHASERVQKWAEGWIGVDRKGTAPGGSMAADH